MNQLLRSLTGFGGSASSGHGWRPGDWPSHRWLLSYALQARHRRPPRPGEHVHVLFCIGDHYEPRLHSATKSVANRRVNTWMNEYPRLCIRFRDSDGRFPRHSFFFPQEEYDPGHLDALTDLCRAGYGEVEIHLHHDRDTAEGLRTKLLDFKDLLAGRHGLLARDRRTGQIRYGFIHGDWALNNSFPGGHWCGVNNELEVLRQTGCYADFTLPSAPSPAQTRTINRIYYACSRSDQPRGHETGTLIGQAEQPPGSLMLIPGPLLLNWHQRKWGLVPRIENGCLQGNQPPTEQRLDRWLAARIQVPNRPDWYFVKLYTHGASEKNMPVLLGEPMARFHEALAQRAARDPAFHYHYVTAREMYNLARAAEAGWTGSVEQARDFELVWNGMDASVTSTTVVKGSRD